MLESKCRAVGLERRGSTAGDGNCFFHAVADQLERIGKDKPTHVDLRKHLTDYMRKNVSVRT